MGNQSNLRGSPSGSSSENEKKTVPMQQKVKATNENSIVEEKSKFEKGIEQEEKDKKHLDDIIADIKDEVTEEEDNLVLKVEDKLETEMQNSKERLKGIMDGVLEGEDKDKILDIEDKVGSLVDEKVRYDLFKAAEDITIQKDQEIDQVVLEDVVKGMKSSDIEIDIEELEANLLEDLTSEINEAEHQIELKLNETVKSIEKEVISETLGINVDIKDLSAPEEKDTAITVKNKKKKNKVKKRESAEDETEESSVDNKDESNGKVKSSGKDESNEKKKSSGKDKVIGKDKSNGNDPLSGKVKSSGKDKLNEKPKADGKYDSDESVNSDDADESVKSADADEGEKSDDSDESEKSADADESEKSDDADESEKEGTTNEKEDLDEE